MYQNKHLFKKAEKYIPGGVNSPVRAFKGVDFEIPLFTDCAKGHYLYDADKKKYLDYVNSWGAIILGHQFKPAKKALKKRLKKGFSFGTCTAIEVEMARLMVDILPNVELVRMVNSGTEACMSAMRLARGYTGRKKILKFEGCYHGHHDSFLIQAGSGAATFGKPSSSGVPEDIAKNTVLARYNNIESVKKCFETNKGEIAAVFVEPVAGNMGCVPPKKDFLKQLRSICNIEKSLLIMDEVMTGFRVSLGGAQERYGILADLSTYGKVIGGGMPVGAFGGKREIMEHIAPLGDVYQAGTLSGNPLCMSVGVSILQYLKGHPKVYQTLEKNGSLLESGLKDLTKKYPVSVSRVGSMLSLFFTPNTVHELQDVQKSDIKQFNHYFKFLLENGVFIPPSPYEAWFMNTTLKEKDIEKTLELTKKFLEKTY